MNFGNKPMLSGWLDDVGTWVDDHESWFNTATDAINQYNQNTNVNYPQYQQPIRNNGSLLESGSSMMPILLIGAAAIVAVILLRKK